MLIAEEVFGMGFALSCDSLKELGHTNYPKPDVHLKEIFHALGLSDGTDLKTYKATVEMAGLEGRKSYEIDKVLWLISSGKYYLHRIECKGLKKELIEFLKSN